MSFLISRIIHKNHLYIDPTPNPAVVGTNEIALLVNGETTMDEIGKLLKDLYNALPSPKRFERRLAEAILRMPLQEPLAFDLLADVVIAICHRQRLNVLPSLLKEEILSTWGAPDLIEEENNLYLQATALVQQGSTSFNTLLRIVNFQRDHLEESLFKFLLEADTAKSSTSTRKILFESRNNCPHDIKDALNKHLLQGPLTTHQKKSLRSESVNQLWMEMQSFSGPSLLKDFFRNKKWEALKEFHPHKIPGLLQKCIDLKLPIKYPDIWREWIQLAPFKTHYPYVIEKLISAKLYSALTPLISIKQPALLKKIEAEIKKTSLDDQTRFCFEALVHAPRNLAEPFIRQLIERTDSIPLLEEIGEELCRHHTYLYAELLLKSLDLFPGTMGIRLNQWQREYLTQPSPERLNQLYSVLTHPRLSPRTKTELLHLLLPQIPSEMVPKWFELLDNDLKNGSLPPFFEAEKMRRFDQGIKERILNLKEPDDALLSDPDYRELLIDHVFHHGSTALRVWVLENGNLPRADYAKLMIHAYQKAPTGKLKELIQTFIETGKTLDDLVLICSIPDLILPKNACAAMNHRLSNTPPDPLKSILIFPFFINNAPVYFPWEHYFSLISIHSKALHPINPQVFAMVSSFQSVPLIIQLFILETLEKTKDAGTLVCLFELAMAHPVTPQVDPCRIILMRLLQTHPKMISTIRSESLLNFLNRSFRPSMDLDTCIFIGDLLAAIGITPSFREFTQKYCRHLLDRYFGTSAFINWSKNEIGKNEKEWNSAKFRIGLDLKKLQTQSFVPKKQTITILFDTRSIQMRILDEQRQTLKTIPEEFQATLLKTIDSATLAKATDQKAQHWKLDPQRNQELLYIFIEEIANFRPAIPYSTLFKNTFCRSLIRQVLHSMPDWDYHRLQTPLLRCFKGNTLPLESISLLETWGYTDLSIKLATFGNMPLDERHHYLQCINILTAGVPYDAPGIRPYIPGAIQTVFLELIEAGSLNLLLCAESALEMNKKYLSEEVYNAFSKQCQDRKISLLPQTINDPFHCSVLLQKNPNLLFQSLPLLASRLIELQGKVLLCENAAYAYSRLWLDRAMAPHCDAQKLLASDVTQFTKLIQLARELEKTDTVDGLCTTWCQELLRREPQNAALNADEKKRLGMAIFLMFKLFPDYFNKYPECFFVLWKISRELLCSPNSLDDLIKHNQLSSDYKPLLTTQHANVLAVIDTEVKRFLSQHHSPAFVMDYVKNSLKSLVLTNE